MASTFVFKLIGVFLALYISLASATPTDGRSANPIDTLRARKVPDSNLCGELTWVFRVCQPTVGVGAWMDYCHGTESDDGSDYSYEAYSSCPPRHVCENLVDEDEDRTIKCVPIQEPGTSKKRKKPTDPQIGSSDVKVARISVKATQVDTEVTVENDMKASVAAVLLSEFLLASNVAIGADNTMWKATTTNMRWQHRTLLLARFGAKKLQFARETAPMIQKLGSVIPQDTFPSSKAMLLILHGG